MLNFLRRKAKPRQDGRPNKAEIERIIRIRQDVVSGLTAHGVDLDLAFLEELLGHLEQLGPSDCMVVLSSDRQHPPIFVHGVRA